MMGSRRSTAEILSLALARPASYGYMIIVGA